MKKLLIVLLLAIAPLLGFTDHKYYLSFTDMEYVEEKKSLQIIINVFMDDIETAINSEYNVDLQLTTSHELGDADLYFDRYLKETLNLKLDGTELTFNYLGREYEGDLVFFYLEASVSKNPVPIEVSNKILVKYFDEQQNIVKLKIGKKRTSKILNKLNDKALLKF